VAPAAVTGWTAAAAPPPLPPGACQVWWARPARARDRHLLLLDDAERERRARLRHAADRDRFTVGCALLRSLLGRLTGVAPALVEVDRTCPDCDRPHGKPTPRDAANLDCSVSHGGDLVVVAVARGVRIGVDVEEIRPDGDVDLVASRALAPAELASLAGMSAADRRRGFYTYWTRKEAVLKAMGAGLRVAPDQVTVSPLVEPPRVLGFADCALTPLSPGERYAACLAALGGELTSVAEFDATELLVDRVVG